MAAFKTFIKNGIKTEIFKDFSSKSPRYSDNKFALRSLDRDEDASLFEEQSEGIDIFLVFFRRNETSDKPLEISELINEFNQKNPLLYAIPLWRTFYDCELKTCGDFAANIVAVCNLENGEVDLDSVKSILIEEIKVYNQWVTGKIFGYIQTKQYLDSAKNWYLSKYLDSAWDYYDVSIILNELNLKQSDEVPV